MSAIPPGADLSKIPLAANPNGDPPNFVNPPSQEATVLEVGLILATISTTIVVLRLVTNMRVVRKLGLDDYLCLIAQVLTTVCFGLAVSFKDTTRHMYDIPLATIDESFVKSNFAYNLLISPTRWCSKATVLALYIRIFAPKKWLRITSYTTLVVTFLFYFVNIPLLGVYCVPRSGEGWDIQLMLRCAKTSIMAPILGAVSIAADVFILFLPLPIVLRLNLAPKRKLGLALVFLAGVFAPIVSCVSFYYQIGIYKGEDKFWNMTNVNACILAESYVTIMVSCAPAIYSFWTNSFTKSAFYTSLRSGPLFSRSSRTTTAKDTNASYPKTVMAIGGPSSQLVHDSNGYYELNDKPYTKTHTEIHASGKESFGGRGTITKSTSIDQLSESG